MPQETGSVLFHLHYTTVELLGFVQKKPQNKSRLIPNPHLKQCGDL